MGEWFVPKGQHDSSQVRSAWNSGAETPVPEGRSKSRQFTDVCRGTEPRHEQAAARLSWASDSASNGSNARAASETRGTPIEKFASDDVQPNLDGMNGFSARSVQPSRWDEAIFLMIPGTSCLATIVLSLRDKIHSTAETLLKLALMWVETLGW